MPPYEIARREPTVLPGPPRSISDLLTAARTSSALSRLSASTVVRSAGAVSEGMVSLVKLQELSGLAREAMSSHVTLSKIRDLQAGADPILHAELGYFLDLFRLGAGEVFNDLVTSYCRESRRLR